MSVEYQKYEFCKYMKCEALTEGKDFCWVDENNCKFTAKTFHKWLKKEGFIIFKAANENEMVMPFTLKKNIGK